MKKLLFVSTFLMFVFCVCNAQSNSELLAVNYSETLNQMIVDGNYDYHKNITPDKFPLPAELAGKTIEVSTKVFTFSKVSSIESVITEMDKDGYRPATLFELLAFSKIQPKSEDLITIVALGSTLYDADSECDIVPYFERHDSKSEVSIIWAVPNLLNSCSFLGVRK